MTTLLKGETSQTSTAVLCALCIVTGTVVLAGTSKWWRGGSRGKAGGGGKRKGLARSPGIRVVRVKVPYSEKQQTCIELSSGLGGFVRFRSVCARCATKSSMPVTTSRCCAVLDGSVMCTG